MRALAARAKTRIPSVLVDACSTALFPWQKLMRSTPYFLLKIVLDPLGRENRSSTFEVQTYDRLCDVRQAAAARV